MTICQRTLHLLANIVRLLLECLHLVLRALLLLTRVDFQFRDVGVTVRLSSPQSLVAILN